MIFFYDIFKIFVGFVLGIYFERWNESRNEKKWVKQALQSLKHDIDLDHDAFKEVIDLDTNRLSGDKKLLDKIENDISKQELFEILDKIFEQNKKDKIWSNVPNYEVNYIDLNQANYISFIKNASRDDLKDNKLKANLDWIFEGQMNLFKMNYQHILRAEYDLKKLLTNIGYPGSKSLSDNHTNQIEEIVSMFNIYFDLREKDIKIKKSIIGTLEKASKRIEKNIIKPVVCKVYQ